MTAVRAFLLLLVAAAAAAAEPAPLLVFLGSGAEPFAAVASARGWEFAAVPEALPGDPAVRQIEAAVAQAGKRRPIDPARTYLMGRGITTAAVFYTVSRRPDLWAAAVAAGGSVEPAIETNRLFGASARLVPILWAVSPEEQEQSAAVRARLTAKGFDLQLRGSSVTIPEAFDWLAGRKREAYPYTVDCETGSPEFVSCYWLRITGFDPAARNDVLAQSRISPGSGAYLTLGRFGYNLDTPGPGVLVSWLPPDYKGPLQLDDRILSIGGTHIKDARDFVAFLAVQTDERLLGVIVARGKERFRLESRIELAKREEVFTARVRGQYLMDSHQLLLITRGTAALHLDLPSYWTPCAVNWNGIDAGTADGPGCWAVTLGGKAQKCQ
jgi:pimeloyl-ACP methyl ester carboxylesterase